jgi:hypothetical protein
MNKGTRAIAIIAFIGAVNACVGSASAQALNAAGGTFPAPIYFQWF